MKHNNARLAEIEVLRPVDSSFRISSPFGIRIHPITKEESFHTGVDFACPINTPIRAMLPGSIFRCGWQDSSNPKKGLGYRVWQESEYKGTPVYLFYGHMNQIFGGYGKKLNEGDVIGLSGSTGSSTGPHLHVQIRIKNTGQYVDISFRDEVLNGID